MSQPISYPPPYIISPTQNHTHTLILLHGTSTSGLEFGNALIASPFPFPPQSPSSKQITTLPSLFPSTKFVFPTGTLRHVTVLNRALKNAWFDMHSFSDRTLGEDDQIAGLRETVTFLGELVRKEVEILGGKRENVIVGGFSQGAAMSAFLLLSGELERLGVKCGGWVCLSGWLPFRMQIQEVATGDGGGKKVVEFVRDLVGIKAMDVEMRNNKDNTVFSNERVFIANGRKDEKVLLTWGQDVRDVLKVVGCTIEMESYDVGHWWCEEMLQGLVNWIVMVWGEDVWRLKDKMEEVVTK